VTPRNTLTDKGRRTRRRILGTAADLFHARGMNATTVGDVLRASGTGKGQFYQHFAGRDALVAAVLSGHRDALAQAPPIRSWADLEAWLRAYLDAQSSFEFRRGCPIGTAAYALQAEQDEARGILKQILDRMRTDIAAFLEGERSAGQLAAEADPGRLAAFAVAGVQGAMLLGVVDRDAAAPDAAITEVVAHLRGFGREEES